MSGGHPAASPHPPGPAPAARSSLLRPQPARPLQPRGAHRQAAGGEGHVVRSSECSHILTCDVSSHRFMLAASCYLRSLQLAGYFGFRKVDMFELEEEIDNYLPGRSGCRASWTRWRRGWAASWSPSSSASSSTATRSPRPRTPSSPGQWGRQSRSVNCDCIAGSRSSMGNMKTAVGMHLCRYLTSESVNLLQNYWVSHLPNLCSVQPRV